MTKNPRMELLKEQELAEMAWDTRTTFPEERLIVALLQTGDVAAVEQLDEALFSQKSRPMVRWIRDQYRQLGELPDLDAFRFEFPSFEPMAAGNSAGFYLGWLRREHLRGQVAMLGDRALKDVLDGKSGEEALAALVQQAQRLQGERASTNGTGVASLASRMVPGGSFIFDGPADVPSVWGHGEEVLWAEGEPFVIVGPDGVGKTTLAQQVALALVGIGDGKVLGYPVAPVKGCVLYLACDRPEQAKRSMRRMIAPEDESYLNERLKVWRGPPEHDFGKYPGTLLEMARAAGADAVIVDSLKDVALGLTDDEVGAGVNQAHQRAVAAGVQVCALHHQRKTGANGGKPRKLEDVYGSRWLVAGAGSVLLLWGEAGNAFVELSHLKQPSEGVGPVTVQHDHLTGTSRIVNQVDPVALADERPNGITAFDYASEVSDNPDRNQVEAARRKLDRLAREGKLRRVEPSQPRDGQGHPVPVRYTVIGRHVTRLRKRRAS